MVLAQLGAEVIVVARFGANDPAAGVSRRRLGTLVQILKGGFRGAQGTVQNLAAKLALYHLVHTVTSQSKKHQKKGVDSETDHVGWNLKVKPVSQQGSQPRRPRVEFSQQVGQHDSTLPDSRAVLDSWISVGTVRRPPGPLSAQPIHLF